MGFLCDFYSVIVRRSSVFLRGGFAYVCWSFILIVVWCGVVWCGVVWCGVVWCGVVWCGVVWCGVVWCGVVWCGVVWCGVVWCGCRAIVRWCFDNSFVMIFSVVLGFH